MSVSQSRKHNRVGDTTHFRLRKRYKSHTSRRTLRLRTISSHRLFIRRLRSCQLYSWSHNLLKLCCP